MRLKGIGLLVGLLGNALSLNATGILLHEAPGVDDFVVVRAGSSATISVDSSDKAIRRAESDLVNDIASVTGVRPVTQTGGAATGRDVILVGVLGKSPRIDALRNAGKLDAGGLDGAWESAMLQTVDHPWAGTDRALVIVGSDRRGAIYGLYWLSESFGVSPWAWWADVPPSKRASIIVAGGKYRLRSPVVKYRGIFLNDEDWGLRPWASRTFDPKTGNIGPKTYRQIFELILRLRGNLLWPAMHPGTRAFNFYSENKNLADEYGVVMGSSHAEPMLRDNVDEWARDGTGEYNYVTNPAGVKRYWEQRVRENARFENIYTLGMRGIHDSEMAGGGTIEQRAARLKAIIGDQRAMLGKYVNKNVSEVPQLFCPYKEVMDIYQNDPHVVPDDVALLWPDDNYGYIQHLSTDAEQQRPGGSGVYYHISYWGRPYDYLWLCTTPPALIGEEMSKALRYGARKIWVVNVGDIKPAEWDTEFFLKLGWDPSLWNPSTGQHAFLLAAATRDFGEKNADEIASILDEYYRLNFQRKPEHVGIDPSNSLLSHPFIRVGSNNDKAPLRLEEFSRLRARVDALADKIAPDHLAAYYELVAYPVRAAEEMNRKWLNLEQATSSTTTAETLRLVGSAKAAQHEIDADTAVYNRQVAGGKWNLIMSDAPRDLAVFKMPPTEALKPTNAMSEGNRLASASGDLAGSEQISFAAADCNEITSGKNFAWKILQGLGYTGRVLASSSTSSTGNEKLPAQSAAEATYRFKISKAGPWTLSVRFIPTWPANKKQGGRVSVRIDGGQSVLISPPLYQDEHDPQWQKNVLRNAAIASTAIQLSSGAHTLQLICIDPDVLVDSLLLQPTAAPLPGYFWPSDKSYINP